MQPAPLLLLCCILVCHGVVSQMVHVEFEPMQGSGSHGDELMLDLLQSLGGPPPLGAGGPGGARGMGPPRPRSGHGQEDELDSAIEGMLGSMLRGPRSGHGMGPPRPRDRADIGVFHDFFPGPLMVVDDSGWGQESPFGAPDPLIMDMLQGIGSSFQDEMLPMIHESAGSARRAPESCRKDLQKHCSSARSQVHCLGAHREDISDACRKDVGKSVPFLCSRAIDQFCSVLQQGILPCLTAHMKEIDGACLDAVEATKGLIEKVNTQKASVTNVQTGEKKVHVPASASPTQLEAKLDAQLSTGETPTNVIRTVGSLAGSSSSLASSQQQMQPPVQKTASEAAAYGVIRVALILATILTIVYTFIFSDSWRRVSARLKPYLYAKEDFEPLTGGIGAAKAPVAL